MSKRHLMTTILVFLSLLPIPLAGPFPPPPNAEPLAQQREDVELVKQMGGASTSSTGGDVWTSGWPSTEEYVRCVAADTATSNIAYAGTSSRIYKTADGGKSWSSLQSSPTGARAIAVHPANPSIVLAGSDSGISISMDSGTSWTSVATFPIQELAIAPSDRPTVYAAGGGWHRGPPTVYKSTDGGTSWSDLGQLYGAGGFATSIAIHPTNPDVVFLTTNNYASGWGDSGLYRSTDGGATWGLTINNTLNAVVVDPVNPAIVYVGADPGSLTKSHDGGNTWVRPALVGACSDVLDLAVSPTDHTVYMGCYGGNVLASSDFGDMWNPMDSGLPGLPVWDLAIGGVDRSQTIYANVGGSWQVGHGIWQYIIAGPDNFADLGNPEDEAQHNLIGWGGCPSPP